MTADTIKNSAFTPARLASYVALSALVLALAGCGNSDDSTENQAENDTPTMSSDGDDNASAEHGSDMADGQQIKDRIIGNTVAGTMSPDSTYTEYYADDGTIKGASYTAKWTIDGDTLCFNYDEAPQADCYAVMIDGNAVEWHLDGETQGKGTIQKGNPNNF